LVMGRVAVKMDAHPVVAAGLMLASIVAVSVMLEMQEAGVVVHAAVMVFTTEPCLVVAVWMIARVAVGIDKHAMFVVSLSLAVMVAASFKMQAHVMHVVGQVVGEVQKMITGAPPFVVLMVVVEM